MEFTTTSGPLYWYKQSNLIMFDNRMYSCGDTCRYLKVLHAYHLQHPQEEIDVRWEDREVDPFKFCIDVVFPIETEITIFSYASVCYTQHKYSEYYLNEIQNGIYVDHLTYPIKKLQRRMQQAARTRFQVKEDKRLALAMSLHERLGTGSLVQLIGLDMIMTILKFH